MPSSRELLGPDGPLASALDAYEARPGHLDRAAAVARPHDEDRVLLCEAGTGTGKTLAYLVPALRSGRKVIISTASRALQEQIFHKDLPVARASLGIDVDARMVKGLGNYLCRRRFNELRASEAAAPPALRRALPLLESWAQRSERGDVAEVEELEEDHPIWREITSSTDTRIGARCGEYEACFVTHMKRQAEAAHVLVVNHHLFLADLAIRGDHAGGVLPPYDAVILDEAHRLEDIATTFFGAQVSSGSVERVLRDASRAFRVAGIAEPALVDRVRALTRRWLAAVNLLSSLEREPLPPETWAGALLNDYHALDDALDALKDIASTTPGAALGICARRIERLRDDFSRIVEPTKQHITWVARHSGGLTLSSSPVDVGKHLREKLFNRGLPVVMTSASLSTGGDFSFVRSRLGLDEAIDAPVDELVVTSAIDHFSQSLLYTPRDLPEVGHDSFAEQAAPRIAELCALTPGGAFVLCTSRRVMRALARELRQHLTPMVQGEAPKATLLERFRKERNAVLVATMSFWEGVDVPGEALRLVVIDRLPFSVPTDPMHAARCKAIEGQGQSPFDDYTLPRAAITLKQGFGRLLRTRADEGVVAILDRRVQTRSYGATLLESLPDVRVTGALDDVAHFWEQRQHDW
jgi:ATP-dependent DNA helicase DinG